MKKESELFSAAVSAMNLGDRLSENSLLRLNPLFSDLISSTDHNIAAFRRSGDPTSKHTRLPVVIVDYVDSPLAGACAFKYNDTYIIAINWGIVLILEFMFNRLLCSPDFFPEIGNSRAESENLPAIPITTNYDDIVRSVHRHGLTLSDFLPRDEERRGVASFLTCTALRFMIGHEFRHIHAGHTDYYANGFRIACITEHVSTNNQVSVAMKKQAMEWDSDKYSLHSEIASCWNRRLKALNNRDLYAKFYLDSKLLFTLCMTACSCFFRLLESATPQPSEWITFSHPPSRVRRQFLMASGWTWGELRFPQVFDIGVMSTYVSECCQTIELMTSPLWLCGYDRNYSLLVCDHAPAHEIAIMAAWRSIMTDLEKYSYVPLIQLPL